jgi:hypothetical protein
MNNLVGIWEGPAWATGCPPDANIRTLGKHPGKKHKNVAKSFLFFSLGEKPAVGEKQKFCFIGFYA